jgi:hypothetical protein
LLLVLVFHLLLMRVNIGNYLRILGKSIFNNLFNSSGYDHGTLTDFNSITDFGYRFINAPAHTN